MDYPNWFASNGAKENFEYFLEGMKGASVHVLQIGAYTGDASIWLFENILTNTASTLTDVDTWAGSDESAHEEIDWLEVECIYDARMSHSVDTERLFKEKCTSEEFFDKSGNCGFDFIYIDGSHTALDVFNDGISAFDCLNNGGVIAFDDYTWDSGKGDFLNPRDGIDGFYLTHQEDLLILTCGTQAWFQKISQPKMLIEEM